MKRFLITICLAIAATAASIQQTVSESYYLKGDTDTLISEVSTTLEQNQKGWSMNFDSLKKSVGDLTDATETEFEEIKKYIRFVDGSILLGEVGNILELKIANNRISFFQSGAEVAYFSDSKLYVTNGHFINSLQLGAFAFIPRDNGNISFKKVV